METVEQLFVPATPNALRRFSADQIIYGSWLSQQDASTASEHSLPEGEELVVVCRNPQTVEVHCHGGSAAVERILRGLAAVSCRPVPAEIWLAEHASDALVIEARCAITQARTTRVATILLDQIDGSLSHAVQEILRQVAVQDIRAAACQLQELLSRAPLGLHLITPWQIALMGPTNVGKSSLINAILGYQRALVCDTAGTTRDVLTDLTAIDGWPVELADTAGLRKAASNIEREGMRRAHEQAASADLVLLVDDLTQPWTTELQQWVDQLERPYLLVHNKRDLVGQLPSDRPDRPAGILTSARDSTGIDELVTAMAQRLVPQLPPPGAAVPFLERHEQTLHSAVEALGQGQLETVQELLNGLLGCGRVMV